MEHNRIWLLNMYFMVSLFSLREVIMIVKKILFNMLMAGVIAGNHATVIVSTGFR